MGLKQSEKPYYTTPNSADIETLIAQMSIEEKVGQTCQITLDAIHRTDTKGQALIPAQIDPAKLKEALETYHVGSILNVGAHTLTREEWKSIMTDVHAPYLKKEQNIPILYGIDAIHGVNYTVGGTLFPQEIGLAATWNTALARQMGEVTAYECRASGIPWNFSPVLDLGRQPLWSRHFETLGEDPVLGTQMGVALVEGYQGKGESVDQFHAAACLKHFVGYSASFTGRDRTPAFIPEKYMQELYFPAFKAAVEKAGSFDIDKVVAASPGIELKTAPEGYVKLHENHHLWSKTRIGEVQKNGQFKLIFESGLIEPNPFPKGYQ